MVINTMPITSSHLYGLVRCAMWNGACMNTGLHLGMFTKFVQLADINAQ